MKKLHKVLLAFTVFTFIFSGYVTAENTTPEPYEENEFPQWAKDLRRTEVISFGSMPFVTLFATLGYGGVLYATNQISSFPNPFDKGSSSFTEQQQINILCVSGLISCGLGLTDLIINLVQRQNKQNRLDRIQQLKGKATVTPITEEEAEALIKNGTRKYEEEILKAQEDQNEKDGQNKDTENEDAEKTSDDAGTSDETNGKMTEASKTPEVTETKK